VKIALSPYAAKLPENRCNPKDYPYFPELVAMLNADGHEVVQIGVTGESRIEGVGQFIQNWPLDKLVEVVRECDTWCSVDSFLPHFCWLHHLKPGVVIWGQSDPTIWGHPQNVNLIKSHAYLRQWQFAPWWDAEYREDVFVGPEAVRDAIYGLLHLKAA
jgi:hypothetical protein